MSEVDFSSLDGENPDMRYPDLDPKGEYLVEVTRVKAVPTRKSGNLFVVDYIVRESNKPGSPVGCRRAFKVFDFDGKKNPDARGLKMANVIGFLAAASGKDPSAKEKWSEAAQYASAKNIFGQGVVKKDGTLLRGGAGVLLRVKTDAPQPTRLGGEFTKHHFSAVEG